MFYPTTEAPGTTLSPATSATFTWCSEAGVRYVMALALAATVPLAGPGQDHAEKGMAGLDAARGNDQRPPYLRAGWPVARLSARRSGNVLGTTVYRIHGTNSRQTIGTVVSSGCFRLTNPDVADLYERIPVAPR